MAQGVASGLAERDRTGHGDNRDWGQQRQHPGLLLSGDSPLRDCPANYLSSGERSAAAISHGQHEEEVSFIRVRAGWTVLGMLVLHAQAAGGEEPGLKRSSEADSVSYRT